MALLLSINGKVLSGSRSHYVALQTSGPGNDKPDVKDMEIDNVVQRLMDGLHAATQCHGVQVSTLFTADPLKALHFVILV